MKLKKILKVLPHAQVKGSKEVEITGICVDSRLVSPGNLFVAKKGRRDDGHRYIPQAVAAGGVAVLTDIFDPFLEGVTQIIVPDVNAVVGEVAAHYYEHPSQELFTVGVTGTNGKTTTGFLVRHLLEALKGPCGLLGTIEYLIGRHRYGATNTTPDSCTCQKLLREMVLQGCHSAVMEATSHGLDQGRLAMVRFNAAIFTNLTQDHLDYHQDLASYARSKAKLFASLSKEAVAILNQDSPWMEEMVKECQAARLTYGLSPEADLRAESLVLSPEGSTFTVVYGGERQEVETTLIGRFNVYNYLAAVAVGLYLGHSLTTVLGALKGFTGVKGRLEGVSNALGVRVYVDFAHTEDALANVLAGLEEFKRARIITVFGCGGDRDRDKRPKMARVAERYSDFVFVTSDNPRHEEPEAIAQDIAKGFKKKKSFLIELDRRTALEKALNMAQEGDIVLVAGKGHEAYQIFAHRTVEFDDAEVCRKILAERAEQLCTSG